VRQELKAEEFISSVNQSIAPDSGLRHMTRKDLLQWTEMGLLGRGLEYYPKDRLTAIVLLRYERDLVGARSVTARHGKYQTQPSAGILQKGCVQVVSCVGVYPEHELTLSGLKETNLISSAGIISVNCGFISKKPIKPSKEGPRAASTGGELFMLQVEVTSDVKIESAMTPLGMKQLTEDDTLFRSLWNLNPDNKPVCIVQREGKISPGDAFSISLPFPPEASEDDIKLIETDKKFTKSYFSTPFIIPIVTIKGVRAGIVELVYITQDRQRVPPLRQGSLFPSRLYPLFLNVNADSMQSIVDFITTYSINLQFRPSTGNPEEDFLNEQRKMRGMLGKARERKLRDQDVERVSPPHEDVMVEQNFLSALVDHPGQADIISSVFKDKLSQGQFIPVKRFYGWLDFMWAELLADVVGDFIPRICRGCGAVIPIAESHRGRPKEYCPQCDDPQVRARERWRRRKGKAG